MRAGDTFIPTQVDNHLWVIISDPAIDQENVVIVNFTTHTVDEEDVCVVRKGEHPFVKRRTAVRYKDAKCTRMRQLEELVKRKLLKPQAQLSAELLQRVRGGASASDFLPEKCREILDQQGLI